MSNNNRRWLVNDSLGQLAGGRTLWHDLRDYCGCDDRSGPPFRMLSESIEGLHRLKSGFGDELPEVIIRNATYFRRLDLPAGPTKTISIAQDICDPGSDLAAMQADVIAHSDCVVFNSEYTREQIWCPAGIRPEVIPIGTDFSLFRPAANQSEIDGLREKLRIAPDSVLFVGSSAAVKGWQLLCDLIDATDFNFVAVTKDGTAIDHHRVRNFGPIPQAELRDIMACCAVLVCTSERETQHLAGCEAMACGLPVVAPAVGIHAGFVGQQDQIGVIVDDRTVARFGWAIERVLGQREVYLPREFAWAAGLSRATCMARWRSLLSELESA